MDSVAVYTENDRRFAIITFEKTADAVEAAAAGTHRIAEHVMKVSTTEAIQQPMNLLGINDDCLLGIMQHLDLKDLCNVASVCDRFKQLAVMVFSSKWKDAAMIVSSVEDVKVFLRHFGSIAESIRLEATTEFTENGNCNSILKLLVEYCDSILTRLEMHNFEFVTKNGFIWFSRSLFAGLRKLVLKNCKISVKWLARCFELVELELIDTHVTYNIAPYVRCPKLESLKIKGSCGWVKKGLEQFLSQNTQLKYLKVIPLPYTRADTTCYGNILNYVPTAIESLTIAPVGTLNFSRFTSLKTLRIVAVAYFSGAGTFIERIVTGPALANLQIEIRHDLLDGRSANAISLLRNIRKLQLHIPRGCDSASLLHIAEKLTNLNELILSSFMNVLNADDLLEVIRHGPNLQLLGLSFDHNCNARKFEINAETYRKMLNMVSRRPTEKPLQIIIFSCENQKNKIEITFPMFSLLKITCLSVESVGALLNIKRTFYQEGGVRMTDAVLKSLRERGLLDSAHDIEP